MMDKNDYIINYGSIIRDFCRFAAESLDVHHSKITVTEKQREIVLKMLLFINTPIEKLLAITEFLDNKLEEWSHVGCE